MTVDRLDTRQAGAESCVQTGDGAAQRNLACDDRRPYKPPSAALGAAARARTPREPEGLASRNASPCLVDPDRWVDGGNDPALKALCRGCPRRWRCAKEAANMTGIEGMVAGVHIPKEGRGRGFALRQLQSLAAHVGYVSQPTFV